MRISRLLWIAVCLILLSTWAIAPAEEEREKIEVKPVLLVIDVQNAWMPMMAEKDKMSAPHNINKAIALFREFGQPVIRVYHTDPERGPEPGTQAFEFPDSIEVMDSDPIVIKNHPSSFLKTDLEKMLREDGQNTVFLCGLSATGCVLATYFGGSEGDFMAFMVKDALLSSNAEYTDMVEDICYSVSLEELRKLLENPFL
jgi:nicotinamidase-related amidase